MPASKVASEALALASFALDLRAQAGYKLHDATAVELVIDGKVARAVAACFEREWIEGSRRWR